MKVVARVVFGELEREFDIACGTGDRTFKWLSNAACQRFALATPSGELRRCDEPHGITDKVSYTPSEIFLPDGRVPHPNSQLKDFLNYGDEVVINLNHGQTMNMNSSTPKRTKWNSVAFLKDGESKSDGCDEDDDVLVPLDKERIDRNRGKAEFMRMVLHSQHLNTNEIKRRIDSAWSTVSTAMPHINERGRGNEELKRIFNFYYGVIADIMSQYATMKGNRMSAQSLQAFLHDAGIFSENEAQSIGSRAHQRICTALRIDEETLDLGGFMAALLICAQVKFVDTYNLQHYNHDQEEKDSSSGSAKSLHDLFLLNIVQYATQNDYSAIIKETFCKEEVMVTLRDNHSELLKTFEKYVQQGPVKEPASSIRVDNFALLLLDGDFATNLDLARALSRELFVKVRHGCLNGRTALQSEDGKPLMYPYDRIPEEEFSYPEFVEGITRAGYHRYCSSGGKKRTIIECFVLGIKGAIEALHKETRR